MSGDRFNYYLKLILNSSLEEYSAVSEQIENDLSITGSEAEELERLINKYMGVYKRFNIKVVNASTGKEEAPPQTIIDNFGNNANYVGTEKMYGVLWNVYTPKPNFQNFSVKRWYYNEEISATLNDILLDVIPGRYRNYFDVPPWVLGTVYAPETIYVPLTDLINTAISRGIIPDWEYLVAKGIPREFVNVLRATNLGSKMG